MTEDEIRDFLDINNLEDDDQEPKFPVIRKLRLPKFESEPKDLGKVSNYEFLKDVKLGVSVELGGTEVKVRDLLSWTQGSIITLNKLAGEAVDIYINDTLIGNGETIIISESFGIRLATLNDKSKR